jgi:hypothetical protein
LVGVFGHEGLPVERTVDYLKRGSNKIVTNDRSCKVGSTVDALWWAKSEPCPKIKQWLEVYHRKQELKKMLGIVCLNSVSYCKANFEFVLSLG